MGDGVSRNSRTVTLTLHLVHRLTELSDGVAAVVGDLRWGPMLVHSGEEAPGQVVGGRYYMLWVTPAVPFEILREVTHRPESRRTAAWSSAASDTDSSDHRR